MRLYEPGALDVREGMNVRTLMERLEMMQTSMATLSKELERSVASYFSRGT